MLDFQTALRLLEALAMPTRTTRVSLVDALGQTLAAPIVMDRDQPGFDRATMDGYALALDGNRAEFHVRGVVAAGQRFEGTLAPGEAVRIMTGAPAPEGTTVIPIELTSAGAAHRPGASGGRGHDAGPSEITVLDPSALTPRRNIARRGEDASRGDVVLEAGTRLAPVHLASAAMAGARELEVSLPPQVAVITTGDEVGREDDAGVRDTNGPLLVALCAALGVPCTRVHADDQRATLEEAMAKGAADADIVVTTGGVSMGDKDLVPPTAAALGFETVFHRVAIQPGKPVFLARRPDGTLLLGLPGNPVSVLATSHLFLVPTIDRWLGARTARWWTLPLGAAHRHDGKRHLFLPAQVIDGCVHPLSWNGSGDLFAAAAGDGLVDLPVGADFGLGEPVRFLPYVGHRLGERGVLPPR